MMNRILSLALAFFSLIIISSCSSNDEKEESNVDEKAISVDEVEELDELDLSPVPESDQNELVKALAKDLKGTESLDTEAKAECAANKIIEGIGLKRLAELGISTEKTENMYHADFNDQESQVLIDARDNCAK